jgi:hypothetical protein
MISVASSASGGLVEALLKEEGRMKDLLDKFDFTRLKDVDKYAISLGEHFSPHGQYNALMDLKTRLSEEGYSTELVYHQNPKDYELVITKTKLESGLVERKFNWLTGRR